MQCKKVFLIMASVALIATVIISLAVSTANAQPTSTLNSQFSGQALPDSNSGSFASNGRYLKIGIDSYAHYGDYGIGYGFQYPYGYEHAAVAWWGEGFTLGYLSGGGEFVANSYESGPFGGLTLVSETVVMDVADEAVYEIVLRTTDNRAELVHTFRFLKETKFVILNVAIKNIGTDALNGIRYRRVWDFDMDNSVDGRDGFNVDLSRNMLYCWESHYAALAASSITPPTEWDIDAWDDLYGRLPGDFVYTGPFPAFGDYCVRLEWVYGSIVPGESVTITMYHIGGDDKDDLDASYDFAESLISPPGVEKSFTESSLIEDLSVKKATLDNVTVSGDFNSTLNFTNFEIVSITTGPFAGKGFSKGQCETMLGGISYKGDWGGALFLRPQERKIYLKGAISGEISATVEGYLTESMSGSGVYDQYQATWKIGRLGGTITSAIINLNGTVSYQSSSEFPATELYILQTNIEGTISGHYSGPLSTVITHIRVVNGTPYDGEGFSIISYVSESGSGNGWTYDKLVSPGRVELKGLFTSPLFGIVSATLDESKTPRTLFLRIERIDLGLPPMADLEVTTWGPGRVSPGQTIDYVIEYRNDGVKGGENVVVVNKLPYFADYVSSSEGGIYRPETHEVFWKFNNLVPGTKGYLSLKVIVQWALTQGTELINNARIACTSDEIDNFLTGISPIDNIEEYLAYQPLALVAIEPLMEEEFNELLTDPDYVDIHQYAAELGFTYSEFTARIIFNDLTMITGSLMFSDLMEEVAIAGKYTDAEDTSSQWVLLRYDETRISLSDRAGGISYDYANDSYSYIGNWGETSSCSKGACRRNCIAKEFMGPIIAKMGRRIGDILKAINCIKCKTETGLDKVDYCSRCFQGILGGIPALKYVALPGRLIFEAWRCELVCENPWDKYDYLCPPGAVDRECTYILKSPCPVAINRECSDDCSWTTTITECHKNSGCTPCINGECSPELFFPNMSSYRSIIAVACDPNIKYGPEGYVQPSQALNYEVEFENEGEGIAFGVYITDVLDEDLDDLTLLLGGNGTYNPSTRTITWFVGEVGPGQGGKFNFSVNVRGDAPKGTEIINFATVYFPSVPEITRTNGVVSIIPMLGAICGGVTHDNGNPVANVTVKVIDSENNQVGDPIVTGSDGTFYFESLLIGTYSVMIVTPLGYSVSPGETQTGIEVTGYPCTEVNFVLTPTITLNDCRTIGYWKHQFDVYLSGRGSAQEDSTELEDYLDLVHLHFDVLGIYTDLENFDFVDAKNVLTVSGGQLMEDRAKQQLFALLLNFASGRIGNETVVSEDGRVAAEAVTYAAILISDGDPANDELAKTICDLINNGEMVETGIIPESPIRYRVTEHVGIPMEYTLNQNYPNPFNLSTSMSFVLPSASDWTLKIYNVAGQLVRTFEGYSSGQVSVIWNGKDNSSKDVASGIYFYKLNAGNFSATKKMVLSK